MKKVDAPHGIYLLDNTPEEVSKNFQEAIAEICDGNNDAFPGPLDVLEEAANKYKRITNGSLSSGGGRR